MNTLVVITENNLVTNIYQVDQHKLDMHMESNICHNNL